MQKPKRPRDANQLGKHIVDLSAGEVNNPKNMQDDTGTDPAAMALGKKGGKARAAKLLSKQRSLIAKKAARARWAMHG
jgi:hypothetical protein